MEEKSQYEKLSDKVIFFILKKYYSQHNGEDMDDLDYTMGELDEITNGMGLGQNSFLDIDYLKTCYELNYELLNSDKLDTKLMRPQVFQYSVDVNVGTTEWINRTYRHTTSSYSQFNVIPIMELMTTNGDISVWDGDEIDHDVYDSETTNEIWNNNSVRKISSRKKQK